MFAWETKPRERQRTRDAIETMAAALIGGLFFGMAAWVLLHAFD